MRTVRLMSGIRCAKARYASVAPVRAQTSAAQGTYERPHTDQHEPDPGNHAKQTWFDDLTERRSHRHAKPGRTGQCEGRRKEDAQPGARFACSKEKRRKLGLVADFGEQNREEDREKHPWVHTPCLS